MNKPLSEGAQIQPQDPLGPASGTPTVVVVDEDSATAADLRVAFQELAPKWILKCCPLTVDSVRFISDAPPSAVVMELGGAGLTGIECTRRLKAARPDLPVVMWTARSDAVSLFLSILVGASGYFIKPTPPETMVKALLRIRRGGAGIILCAESQAYLAHFVKLCANGASGILSSREQQILSCLLQNLADKDIAEQLGISYSTLHAHLESIYRRLNAHTRVEAVKNYLSLNSE